MIEIKNERPKIIAVDYDNTLFYTNWPDAGGDPNWKVIKYIASESAKGSKIILWTCRRGVELLDAINMCRNIGLYFDAINENLPEMIEKHGGDTRKVFADEYIDDRNKYIINI